MRILLIKRGAIGDLLMATPLIRQLKQKTGCQLDLLVGQSAVTAIKDNPYIDNSFIIPDSYFAISGVLSFFRALWKLRKNYDYVFLLDKHWYFNLMSHLMGGKVVGYYRELFGKLLLNKAVCYNDVNRYHGLYYLDLLTASSLADADYTDLKIDLVITDSDKDFVNNLVQEYMLNNFVIVVNSGGNNAYEKTGLRMLPYNQIIKLLKALLSTNFKIILLGGGNDYSNYDDYIKEFDIGHNILNLAGKLNLAQSAYLVSLSQKFYTTDCGAMHLGVAMNLGTRMIAFFGPTNPRHILPECYLPDSAMWQDESLYDPQYQLKGVVRHHEPLYFSTLNLTGIVSGAKNPA